MFIVKLLIMDSIHSRNTKCRDQSDPHLSRNHFHGAQPRKLQHVSIPQPHHLRVYIPRPHQPAGVSMMRIPNWSN